MKTTAIVEYRDHVPYGWFAVEFCDVKFLGPNSDELDDMWHKIEYKKYDEKKLLINERKVCKDNLLKQIEKFRSQINKPWYRFWHNSEEREKLAKIRILEKEIMDCDAEIEELEEDRFYSAIEKVAKAEVFLTEQGFILHSSSSSGDECVTHKDIWYRENS